VKKTRPVRKQPGKVLDAALSVKMMRRAMQAPPIDRIPFGILSAVFLSWRQIDAGPIHQNRVTMA
jgi:hypothetical protein